ncbi:MAG TPA: bifunctional UDP-N-acetylglucosamine diphosphorylase/glucosamine-1-phosphate N-acetyltransferase GlmU [Candidatus Dormibacteraeota bacterium]
MRDQPLSAVILAAGLGTRMRSRTPKVLHPVAGKAIIDHVLDACEEAGIRRIVTVVNSRQPELVSHLGGRVEVAYQDEQKGSGHALAQAPADVLGEGDILVLNGDAPLVRPETIQLLAGAHRRAGTPATLASVEDPTRADGRVIRDAQGKLDRIVEYGDATAAEREVGEVNVGLYAFRGGSQLLQALAGLQPANVQGELYLTDLFRALKPVEVVRLEDAEEGLGVNDRVQLAKAEKVMRRRVLERLMRAGVTVIDPDSTYVDAGVRVGEDSVLEPGVILRGATLIGRDCRIGPFAEIRNSRIGDGCRIEHSWLDGVRVAEGSDCGPFSKLRPGTEIGLRVHVGSFAEIVRSRIGAGSAVPHVSYLGDATVGERVNVGAGTITANYDREKDAKFPTEIGDDGDVGVDTLFVAPRKMGRRAKTGAGSVVNKDVPDDAVVVGAPARVIRKKAPVS